MERIGGDDTTQMFDEHAKLAGVVATIKDITDEAAPQRREVIAESGADAAKVVRFRYENTAACSQRSDHHHSRWGKRNRQRPDARKTLHYQSLRQAEPFIAINCAAIPDSLLESELFGYEKGAFTDARAQKRGIFELADRRETLFLDEIGEIPMMLQAKLLRVLEEQTFRRLGGLKDINLDLRVVAATNKNLREAVKEGGCSGREPVLPPQRDPDFHPAVAANAWTTFLPLARFFIDHYNH